MQMTYGISSAHVQWSSNMEKVEQTIVMSPNDVTMITHAIWGGKYISRVCIQASGSVVWVSGTECLGLLLSH